MSDGSSTPAAAAAAPLLAAHVVPRAEEEIPTATEAMAMVHPNDDHPELYFYDPHAVLVSRDVAFGYLILLTGGAVDYEPPTPEGEERRESQPKRPQHASTLDEEAAALAYAAILDGNVLHACFGLKASASGRPGDANILGQKASSSIFCCFPSPGAMDALQLVLPHAAKNKVRMQNLVEILREVQDMHHEAVEAAAVGRAKLDGPTVYEKVIAAYTHCFRAIVRYHDARKDAKGEKAKSEGSRSNSDSIMTCCSDILHKLARPFSKPKIDPELEKMQQEALKDIESGFDGLKEAIWEGLEAMATETAFTGVSVEE